MPTMWVPRAGSAHPPERAEVPTQEDERSKEHMDNWPWEFLAWAHGCTRGL